MLRCETDTPEMEAEVRKAFEAYNAGVHQGGFQYDFEHGQWHVTCLACGAQWSVNDLNDDDFDFDQVSEGDEFCESESDEQEEDDEQDQPECTLYTEGVCKGELWECESCGEEFCQTHWHRTDKGHNVECSGCEKKRTGHSS